MSDSMTEASNESTLFVACFGLRLSSISVREKRATTIHAKLGHATRVKLETTRTLG